MYVRDAKNREEVWLLDRIEELALNDPAFRSRDYVVAIDETTGEKAGFGRIRIHRTDPEVCELTTIGVLPEWRRQGVGAHVIERLIEHAKDHSFSTVYALASEVEYLTQFGFEPLDRSKLPEPLETRLERLIEEEDDVIGLRIDTDGFEMPERLREAFKLAGRRDPDEGSDDGDDVAKEAAVLREEFGIDPEETTYKYDTGN